MADHFQHGGLAGDDCRKVFYGALASYAAYVLGKFTGEAVTAHPVGDGTIAYVGDGGGALLEDGPIETVH